MITQGIPASLTILLTAQKLYLHTTMASFFISYVYNIWGKYYHLFLGIQTIFLPPYILVLTINKEKRWVNGVKICIFYVGICYEMLRNVMMNSLADLTRPVLNDIVIYELRKHYIFLHSFPDFLVA